MTNWQEGKGCGREVSPTKAQIKAKANTHTEFWAGCVATWEKDGEGSAGLVLKVRELGAVSEPGDPRFEAPLRILPLLIRRPQTQVPEWLSLVPACLSPLGLSCQLSGWTFQVLALLTSLAWGL